MRDGIVDAVRDVPRRSAGARGAHHRRGRRVLRGHGPQRVDRRRRPASPASSRARHPRRCASGVQTFIRELWELDKPTIAAVNGAAVGPGAHLALACDFVFVQPATRFIWTFAMGPRRRRGRRLPAAPPRRPAARQGDGDARRGRDRRRSGRPRPRVPVRRRRRGADAAKPLELTRRLAAGPTRSLGLSKRLLNAIVRDRPRATRSSSRATSRRSPRRRPTSSRAWPPSARSATRSSTAPERSSGRAVPRIQRVAAYNVCIDDDVATAACAG